MQNDTLVAVDIAKEVFELGVSDRPGRVVTRRRLARYEFLEFFAQHSQATVVMEAVVRPTSGRVGSRSWATWWSCCRRSTSGPTW